MCTSGCFCAPISDAAISAPRSVFFFFAVLGASTELGAQPRGGLFTTFINTWCLLETRLSPEGCRWQPSSCCYPLLAPSTQPGILEEPEADSPAQLLKMLTSEKAGEGLPPGTICARSILGLRLMAALAGRQAFLVQPFVSLESFYRYCKPDLLF